MHRDAPGGYPKLLPRHTEECGLLCSLHLPLGPNPHIDWRLGDGLESDEHLTRLWGGQADNSYTIVVETEPRNRRGLIAVRAPHNRSEYRQ